MVNEAIQIIQGSARDFGVERTSLQKGIGRILREDWHCDRDLPPYDRVTMDGIALNFEGARDMGKLKIEGVIAAGDPQSTLSHTDQCVEIMTGAILPHGADTIVRYEDVEIEDGYAVVNTEYRRHQNIHWQGEDRKKDELLVPSGALLSASEIGVGASVGRSEIVVSRHPRTIVISTGNELVEVDEQPLPHQIRRGNVYRIQSTLQHLGLSVDTAHIRDDKEETIAKLSSYLAEYDLIILSGGVSKGKFDFLPGALERCGVVKHFHKVAQRPGKPLWFGTHLGGATVFALPGNPVSSFMCLTIYLIDWLRLSMGLSLTVKPKAVLTHSVTFKPALTYFLEVGVGYNDEGLIMATPQKGNGSGDLANLLNGDAFIRLPMDRETFNKGEVFPLYFYRSIQL